MVRPLGVEQGETSLRLTCNLNVSAAEKSPRARTKSCDGPRDDGGGLSASCHSPQRRKPPLCLANSCTPGAQPSLAGQCGLQRSAEQKREMFGRPLVLPVLNHTFPMPSFRVHSVKRQTQNANRSPGLRANVDVVFDRARARRDQPSQGRRPRMRQHHIPDAVAERQSLRQPVRRSESAGRHLLHLAGAEGRLGPAAWASTKIRRTSR